MSSLAHQNQMSGEEEQKTKPGWRERMGMSNWTSSAVNTDEESDQASMSQVEPESVEEEKESRWSRVKSWTKTKVKEMRTEKKDAPEGGVIRLQV